MKFPSGIMICTKTVTASGVTFTAWGSWYESPLIALGDFPVAFTTVPIVTASLNNSGMACTIGGMNPTKTALGNTRVFRPNSVTGSVTIGIIAIGTWK